MDYSVLMLVPEYLAESYGREVRYLYVTENSADEAIAEAQRQAFEEAEVSTGVPADWHVLLVVEGHQENIAPPAEPDRRVTLEPNERNFLTRLLREVSYTAQSGARSGFAEGITRKLMRGEAEGDAAIRLTEPERRFLEDVLFDFERKEGVDEASAKIADEVVKKLIMGLPLEP